jgi:hypothetical protein
VFVYDECDDDERENSEINGGLGWYDRFFFFWFLGGGGVRVSQWHRRATLLTPSCCYFQAFGSEATSELLKCLNRSSRYSCFCLVTGRIVD